MDQSISERLSGSPARTKRIVFLRADGVPQILGTDDGWPRLPVTTSEGVRFQSGGRQIEFASLVRVTTRAAFYKEPVIPRSYGSFHPDQV